MSNIEQNGRSPELMSAGDTALVVIDVQEKLMPAINDVERVERSIRDLLDAASLLGVRVVATEQYPQGLGPTVTPVYERLGDVEPAEKKSFSCAACGELFEGLIQSGISKLLLCGVEAHVCVQQTALDLMGTGWKIFIAADAVGSRRPFDREIALRRLADSGATITTTESAIFEWCGGADHPQFKAVSSLVRQRPL